MNRLVERNYYDDDSCDIEDKDRTMEDLCQSVNAHDSSVAVLKYERHRPVLYTDVAIIGNGPSALALSAFLAGYHPYYNEQKPHPHANLHEKLLQNVDKSIMEQDFADLSEGLEGRSSHPSSLLYDSLVRPNADLGDEHPSTLRYVHRPNKLVPHVVLGKGTAGGSWNEFSPEIITLSLASWLDLPAYSFRDWLEKEGANFATELQMKIDTTAEVVGRVPCAAVQRYFKDYTKHLGIEKHFVNFAYVTCIQRIADTDSDSLNGYQWYIRGCHSFGPFQFRAKNLVLATGVGVPKSLGLIKENQDFRRVFHSMIDLERVIPKLVSCPTNVEPVLVVGDGLSAADAVIKLLISGISVVHSFRKTPRDTKSVLSKLSSTIYPEYHTVFRLMTGAITDPLYVVHQRTEVVDIQRNHGQDFGDSGQRTAILKHIISKKRVQDVTDKQPLIEVNFSYAIILIGFQADLSFFADNGRRLAVNSAKIIDSKSNVININPFTYQCINEQNMYVIGPLVGDNFVRYAIGGSLATASHICAQNMLSS